MILNNNIIDFVTRAYEAFENKDYKSDVFFESGSNESQIKYLMFKEHYYHGKYTLFEYQSYVVSFHKELLERLIEKKQ